ncbi:Periodic tryptophan protein 2 -like protein [Echinococcus granulosus]|nr:Periodic tryptophan protein 2 -like protein [Echinococcus granulosus]
MKLGFKFTNLFGTVYKSGNLEFTHNGSCLLSPVGNHVTIFHLLRDEARTLFINSQFNLTHIAVSPILPIIFAVNTNGDGSLVSLLSGGVINTYKYLAIAKNHCIMIFLAPEPKRSANSLELYRFLYGFQDSIKNIDWSSDSRFIIAGSEDMTARILSVKKCEKLIIYTLSGHKAPVFARFCGNDTLDCFTLGTDGELKMWTCDTKLKDMDVREKEKGEGVAKATFRLTSKYFYRNALDHRIPEPITTITYHRKLQMLVAGFENGIVMLHQLPEFTLIDRTRLLVDPLSALSMSPAGDWVAMASEGSGGGGGGNLAVWEWRSRCAHLRAASHAANEVAGLAYSPDGRLLATGGRDAKVRLWRVASGGRAVVTFHEHAAPITAVAFPTAKPKVLLSASLDGTIRAFDLNRYRNFRTMSVPNRGGVQFSCLAVDSMGELVASGALDTFEGFIFALRTGDLLACLTGHTAPVSAVQFNPALEQFGRLEVLTASWDASVRTWSLAECEAAAGGSEGGGCTLLETISVPLDVVCTAYRHDGRELAVALLNATILLFDPAEGTQLGSIEGRCDLDVAQVSNEDHVTPHRAAKERKFLSIAYSTDGQHLLAAGDSKFICLYSVTERLLVKRFELTVNLSLEGVQEAHDRRRYLAVFSAESAAARADHRDALLLPGVRSGDDHCRRWWRPDVRVASVSFAPTGDAFAVAATEGVFVYTIEKGGLASNLSGVSNWLFDAVAVDEEATPSNARLQLAQGNFSSSLDIALRLQIPSLIEEVIETVPHSLINFLTRNIPLALVLRSLVPFLARQLEGGRSRHIAFYTAWVDSVFVAHASSLRKSLAQVARPRHTGASQLHLLGLEEANAEATEERLKQPGVLLEHGEFKLFQASLVRLQTALEGIKASLINRLDGLDATWSYLSQIGRLSRGKKDYPLPLKAVESDEEDESKMEACEESLSMGAQVVDLDDLDETIARDKMKAKRASTKRKIEVMREKKSKRKKEREGATIVV